MNGLLYSMISVEKIDQAGEYLAISCSLRWSK